MQIRFPPSRERRLRYFFAGRDGGRSGGAYDDGCGDGAAIAASVASLLLVSSRQRAILAVRHTLIKAIRDYFDERGFTLVDSPILTPAACEGTSTLFEVPYFDLGKAYLGVNDPKNALGELVRAADLLPNDTAAQLDAAKILILLHQYADARARAVRSS